MKTVTHTEVVRRLKRLQGADTLRQFGERIGVSASYLSRLYRGERRPSGEILDKLGLSREDRMHTVYRESNGNDGKRE